MIGQFDLIVVSPLRRALQTVFEIFGQQASVKIVIEPLLAPQLNNASSMGATSNCKILSECKATVDDSIITESLKPWYVSFMSEEHKTELSKRR